MELFGAMGDTLKIRPLETLDEYEACAGFQEEVWGRGFSERVPPAILMIANRIGGLAAGAFDPAGTLQGFVFGLTGVVDGRLLHWSDMLAVREGFRDRGLGTRLKAYQREVMLGRGVLEMRWTFDPLQARNAHVNFKKLGIVTREYVENMYGDTDSPLHRGVGTDRLVASWRMDSERVRDRLRGSGERGPEGGPTEVPIIISLERVGTWQAPGPPRLGREDPSLLLPVPSNVVGLMNDDPSMAVRWRGATREAFQHYLARGYEIREFFRGGPVGHYLLVRGDTKA
jgi:predicted GNAT superfamily acetyltransferase